MAFRLTSVARRFASSHANPLMEHTKKKPSRIRAVFFGFLSGITAAGGVAYALLTEDIERESGKLLQSLDVVRHDVSQVRAALEKVSVLEKEVEALRMTACQRQELQQLRDDLETEKNSLASSLAQHKAEVWEGQEEMYKSINKLEKS